MTDAASRDSRAWPGGAPLMIHTTGLRKSFSGGRRSPARMISAVRGVDLTVRAGEVFGLLGPNGAGKTTTLRMLATLLRPDGGHATVAGADLRRQAHLVRQRIGYVAQAPGTSDAVSAREELVLQARMHGITKAEARRRAATALAAFELTGYADRRCGTYSGGQRRRLDIALGVIHAPTVLFLDEPTAALDPQGRAHVWAHVRRLRDDGMTVCLTTHYLEEADALCDRVAILDHGEVVATGTPEELKMEIGTDVLTVSLNGSTLRAAELLAAQPYVHALEVREHEWLRISVAAGAAAIPRILRELNSAGMDLNAIELHRPSLDDVFLAKTGRSLREP